MVLPVDPNFQSGMLSERYAQQQHRNRDQRDANETIRSWQTYAAQLESRLQQLQRTLAQVRAESYAAQYQRNVVSTQCDQLQAEIRRLDPRNPFGDVTAMIRASREQVDRHLATKGLQVDRSNPNVFRVVGQLR